MKKSLKNYRSLLKGTKSFFVSSELLRKLYAYIFHPRFLVGVNFIAFNKNEEVLLAEHLWKEKYQWRTPGGLVGKNEDLKGALVREIKEELEISIDKNRLFYVGARKTKYFPRIDIYFFYDKYIPNNLKPSSEIKTLRLFKVSALPSSLFPGQAEVIKRSSLSLSAKN